MNNIWDSIVGQEKPKNLLSKIVSSNKIPHAFLFVGPEGVGKYFTAIRFSQLLNTETGHEFSTDNTVSNKIAHHSEPYIKYILPLPRGKNETSSDSPLEKLSKETLDQIRSDMDAKIKNPYYDIKIQGANFIKISSIREIKRFLAIDFDEIKYRVILISDADLMNDEAQNALLKSLEEPPNGVIFILLTSKKDKLLETIVSRCWTITFEPLKSDEIVSILVKYFGIDESEAKATALFANGSVYKALEFLKHEFSLLKSRVINILRFSLASKYHSAVKEIQPLLSDQSGDTLRLLIQLITFWFVDVLKNKNQIDDYFFREDAETMKKFNLRFTEVNIDNLVERLGYIEQAIGNNVNLNILALNLIFELASLRFNRM